MLESGGHPDAALQDACALVTMQPLPALISLCLPIHGGGWGGWGWGLPQRLSMAVGTRGDVSAQFRTPSPAAHAGASQCARTCGTRDVG